MLTVKTNDKQNNSKGPPPLHHVYQEGHCWMVTSAEIVPKYNNSRWRKGRVAMGMKTSADWVLGNVQKGPNFKHQEGLSNCLSLNGPLLGRQKVEQVTAGLTSTHPFSWTPSAASSTRVQPPLQLES